MELQEDNYHRDLAVSISVILNILFMILTVVGNLIALLVLGQASQLRTTVRLLMANLAVPDLTVGAVVLPYVVSHALNGGIESTNGTLTNDSNSDILCQAVGLIRILSLTGSSFTLIALSYERYVAIAYPFKHIHMITPGSVFIYAAVVWTLATIVGVLPLFGLGRYQYSQHQFVCWPEGPIFPLVFVLCVFCATFITMVSMYLCIFRAVKKHRSIIHALVFRIAQGFTGQKVERFRATTTISLVLGVYCTTWAPFCCTQLFPILFNDFSITSTSEIIVTCFLYANAACNPWIYCGLNAKFRNTLKKKARGFWKWLRGMFATLVTFDTGRITDHPHDIRIIVVKPSSTQLEN